MQKAHFIGIAGVGMSAVAKLLKDIGWEITGSDEAFYPPVSTYLEEQNISLQKGYSSQNIPNNADIIVIGKNAKLIPETNEEVREAINLGKPIKSFPELLGEITKKRENTIIAGSYGKSTCTALMSWILMDAGKNPGYFIGAIPKNLESTSELGIDKIFILEGDEYPTSNTDSKSKFLHMRPHDLLLTSAEHDHINVFPTLEKYLEPFKKLLALIPSDGLIIYNSDEANVRKLVGNDKQKISYGLKKANNPTWSVENIKLSDTSTFDLTKKGSYVAKIETSLLGIHNIQNIVGVSAFLLEKELLTVDELISGIESFEGIQRRLDLKTKKSEVLVFEGFGSSYEKARSALKAIRDHFPKRNVIVVFEPHTFGWRNRANLDWYSDVFKGSRKVLLYKPATQGLDTHEQLSHGEIFEAIKKSGVSVEKFTTPDEGLDKLANGLEPSDVILIMTSGSMDGIIEKIPKLVEKMYPKNEKI